MKRTYVGRREQGGKVVEVSGAGWKRPLTHRGRRRDSGFGWGTQAAGSVALARAILRETMGADSSDGMAIIFAGDVISQLPDEAFLLSEATVRDWLEDQGQRRMSPHELVEHLGSIALAEPEEEAAALRGLVDRCWTGQSLVN